MHAGIQGVCWGFRWGDGHLALRGFMEIDASSCQCASEELDEARLLACNVVA